MKLYRTIVTVSATIVAIETDRSYDRQSDNWVFHFLKRAGEALRGIHTMIKVHGTE